MYFSSEKARRELGYEPSRPQAAVERAVAELLGNHNGTAGG